MVDGDSMAPGLTRVQTSPNVNISQYSNDHISVVREATVRWLRLLVVLHMLVCSNSNSSFRVRPILVSGIGRCLPVSVSIGIGRYLF